MNWHTKKPDDGFLAELALEMLKTDRLRAILVLGVSLFFAGVVIFMGYVIPPQYNPVLLVLQTQVPFGLVALTALVSAGFEGLIVHHLSHSIRTQTQPHGWVFYLNAATEVSLPTVLMAFLIPAVGPTDMLNSPFPLFYLPFILLSTLRLDVWLSLATGTLAGVEFTALALAHRAELAATGFPRMFSDVTPYLAKGMVMVLLGVLAGLVGRQLRTRLVQQVSNQRERNRIEGLFGQHVSPSVARHLISGELDAGHSHAATILFLDIRGFTAFSESLPPEQVMTYLNELFGHMIRVVDHHQGIINKFLGDGFMAVFGAISPHEDTPRLAVSAAQDLLATVETLVASGAIPPTRVGIGIHHGPVMLGIVGSETRKEFTVIGDTVNLASRVEALNKEFHSTLLVTHPVHACLSLDVQGQFLQNVSIRGREQTIGIYKLA